MPRQHTTNDKYYAANRRALLADNPPCNWCGAVATEADHIIPHAAGGSDDLENLTPSCRRCNASRGASFVNAKRKAAKDAGIESPLKVVKDPEEEHTQTPAHKRTKPAKSSAPTSFFINETTLAPVAPYRISQEPPKVVGTSHDWPRLETITPDDAPNKADEIAEFSRAILGVELMPWQLRVAAGVTSMDDDGNYLRRVALSSVSRQNGKTQLLAAIIGHHLTIEGPRRGIPQVVMSVAHKLDLAVSLFKYLAPILEERFGAKVSWSYGRNELELHGHRWLIRAATPQAGHGYSVDLVTADEVWSISEAALDEGLFPTQRARRNPLFLMFSTAGTEQSTAMLRWRAQGIRQIDAGDVGPMYFASWEPPAGIDPMTPEAWAYANPALGYTLDMGVIESESKSPNRSAFLRSSVNLWTATASGWLEPGLFESCITTDTIPPGGVLAVEADTDQAHYVGVRAIQHNGKTMVTVSFQVDTVTQMWAAIEKELSTTHSLRLAITPTLEVTCPPKWERRRTIVGFRELSKWTAAVRSMITEGRLVHTGEISLMENVERAVMVKYQASVVLSSARSSGPITLARCMVFAAAMASRPASNSKPALVFVGR